MVCKVAVMKTFSRSLFTMFGLTVLAAMLDIVPLSAGPRPAMLTSGNVIIKRKNVSTTSSMGGRGDLQAGDVVATSANSTASLQFADGSKVSLSGGSAIEITGSGKNKTLMRALNGRVAAHLKSGQTIATRSAMIRVKGTEIIITIASDGATTLEVIEGAAEFFSPCGKVLVQHGERSEAKPGNAPSAPTQIPNLDALLKEWQTKNIEFDPAPEASRPMPRLEKAMVTSVATDAPQVKPKPAATTETKSQSPPLSEPVNAARQ